MTYVFANVLINRFWEFSTF